MSEKIQIKRQGIEDTFFYRYRREYPQILQNRGMPVNLIMVYTSLYDNFMSISKNANKSNYHSRELQWMLNDDLVLMESCIFTCHLGIKAWSKYFDKSEALDMMESFAMIPSHYSSCIDDPAIMDHFHRQLRMYDKIPEDQDRNKYELFFKQITYAISDRYSENEDGILDVFRTLRDSGKCIRDYFYDYIDTINVLPDTVDDIIYDAMVNL